MREPATEGAGANWRLDKRQRSGKQTLPARPGEDTAPAAGRLQCVSGTSDGGRSCFSFFFLSYFSFVSFRQLRRLSARESWNTRNRSWRRSRPHYAKSSRIPR